MIRPLRRRHLAVFVVLAIVLPLLYWAGIAARKPIVRMEVLPEPLVQEATGTHEP